MPPKLEIFYGRDDYVECAVETVVANPEGARLTIQGPGGMGKTSVSSAIIHDTRVSRLFGTRCYWIPCELATSIILFLELIARSLEISSTSSDRLKDITSTLKQSAALHANI